MSGHPTWPELRPEDPWDDPPADDGYEQLCRYRGEQAPGHDAYRADVAALLAALRDGAPCDDLGRELGVDGHVHARGGDEESLVDRPATLEELVRVATDHWPAAGGDAPDMLLGPWADALDPVRPRDRHALTVALAGMAVMPSDRVGQTPYRMWAQAKPRPPVADRARVRAVLEAPWTVWVAQDGRRVDLFGVSRWEDPVAGPLGAVVPCDVQAAPWVARVVGTPGGARVAIGFAVPRLPPPSRLASIHREALWRGRLADRRSPVQVAMAREGHVVPRRIHEWLWATPAGPDAPPG